MPSRHPRPFHLRQLPLRTSPPDMFSRLVSSAFVIRNARRRLAFSCSIRRVHRAIASYPRRYRRNREKHQESTSRHDAFRPTDEPVGRSLSINRPKWRGWRRRDLPSSPLEPFVDSDSLLATLVSRILRVRTQSPYTPALQRSYRRARTCGRVWPTRTSGCTFAR